MKIIIETNGGVSFEDLQNMPVPKIFRHIKYLNDYADEVERQLKK